MSRSSEKFSYDGRFLVKTKACTNDYQISPKARAKLLNQIRLKIISKFKLPAWKLIRDKIPTKETLRKRRMGINGDCPLYNNNLENIDLHSDNLL